MSPAERGHAIERFDYSAVGTELAVLRLLARLGADGVAPAGRAPAGKLLVTPAGSDRPHPYPVRASTLERRLLPGATEDELLWHAWFALPLELMDVPHTVFRLLSPGVPALTLPTPGRRVITNRELALSSRHTSHDRVPVLRRALTRHRLAAVATVVVVTSTSTPSAAAVSVAATSSSSAGTTTSVTAVTPAVTTTDAATVAAATPAVTTPASTPAATSTPAPATTTVATTTATTATATTTAPVTTVTPAPATPSTATSSTPAGPAATAPRPAASSTGGRHVVSVGPTTASGHRHADPSRLRVEHLFTATARPAQHRSAHPAQRRPASAARAASCTTTDATGPIAYAAATPAVPSSHRSVRVRCATPAAGHRTSARDAAAPGAILTILGPARDTGPARNTGAARNTGSARNTGPARNTGSARSAAPAHRAASAGTSTSSHGTRPSAPHRQPTARHAHPAVRHASGGAAVAAPAPRPVPLPVAGESSGSSTGTVYGLSSTAPGFLVPSAWTGTVTADPSLTGAVSDLSGLLSNGDRPPSFLIPIYMQAGKRYGVPWTVLAAINAIETDYGRDLNTSSAGAVGWMQFEPSTWREWGVAADGHSVPNPYDPRDAIFSAARYLAAAGARANLTQAIYAYNHAGWYVDEVLTRAHAIATHAQYERATLKRGTFSVYFATGIRRRPTIRYRGGYLSHFDRLISAANMVSAANFPYQWGGGHEQPARFGPFDCSGSVSYVLQQAGYKVPTTVSGNIPTWKFPAGPGRVTIFYSPVHTFMRIGNRYFGTSGFARPGGGAGWFDVDKLPASYLAGFREVHLPHLGPDSFSPAPHRAQRPA